MPAAATSALMAAAAAGNSVPTLPFASRATHWEGLGGAVRYVCCYSTEAISEDPCLGFACCHGECVSLGLRVCFGIK